MTRPLHQHAISQLHVGCIEQCQCLSHSQVQGRLPRMSAAGRWRLAGGRTLYLSPNLGTQNQKVTRRSNIVQQQAWSWKSCPPSPPQQLLFLLDWDDLL